MSAFLGIDTSNYTTSIAIYDDCSNEIVMQKKLLPVASSTLGLRQSDAVFAHIKQLPQLFDEMFCNKSYDIKAVGVSTKPRNVDGSYMPAFLVGNTVAAAISAVLNVKKYECSHQEGHIVAALHSANSLSILENEFYAFHVSGGTTEALLVSPSQSKEQFVRAFVLAKTLDLHAGQLIDRVGVMLGLGFPCGKELTEIALNCHESFKIKPSMKDMNVHFSGVQNQCEDMLKKAVPKEYIARYVIEYIKAAIDNMTAMIIEKNGSKPLLYAGGVMSNVVIKEYMQTKYNAIFAQPQFSTDNAAGVAIIASRKFLNSLE